MYRFRRKLREIHVARHLLVQKFSVHLKTTFMKLDAFSILNWVFFLPFFGRFEGFESL